MQATCPSSFIPFKMGSPVVPCNDPLKEGGVLGAVSTIPYRNFLSIFTPHLTATAAFWEHLHHLRWNSRSGSGEWEPTLQKQLANVVSQMLRVTTPQPIIFRGYVSYDPYFWGLKLSFFMYHSHGSYGYAKKQRLCWVESILNWKKNTLTNSQKKIRDALWNQSSYLQIVPKNSATTG